MNPSQSPCKRRGRRREAAQLAASSKAGPGCSRLSVPMADRYLHPFEGRSSPSRCPPNKGAVRLQPPSCPLPSEGFTGQTPGRPTQRASASVLWLGHAPIHPSPRGEGDARSDDFLHGHRSHWEGWAIEGSISVFGIADRDYAGGGAL
jgi:hypothetical protein